MKSPDAFLLRCKRREDGSIQISSHQIPGLVLASTDIEAVFRDLPKAIDQLTRRNILGER